MYKTDTIMINGRIALRLICESFIHREKAIYLGWLNHSNLGDEALFQAIKNHFADVLSFYDLEQVERLIFKSCVKRYSQYFLLGGGTLINRNEAVLNWCLDYANSMDESFVFGTGVASEAFWTNFERRANRIKEWKAILSKCFYVGVRGPVSLAWMNSLGARATIIGDPVMSLGRHKITPKPKSKRVGLNFGMTNNKLWGGNDKIVWKVCSELIDMLLQDGWDVSFFNVFKGDLDQIYLLLKEKNMVERIGVYDGSNCDIVSALKYFDNVDVFIGEKLHSVVFAAITFTPLIMVEYRPKCFDFMSSIGLDNCNIRTDIVQAKWLFNKLKEVYSRGEEMQDRLYAQVTKYRNIQNNAAAFIKEYIRNNR
jgi:hypothetical protein